MTVVQFLSILRARWWVVLLALAVIVAGTVGVSLALTKQYTATASVVVDSKPDPVSAVLYQGTSPAYMATQVDIIQSERVAIRVIRNLKLDQNPKLREQWMEATKGATPPEVWLSSNLKNNLEVKPSRESSVINISYKAPDPKFAAGMANAFVQAYVDTSLDMRVDPAKQFSSFFDNRAKDAREALEKAQAKVSAYQRERGIMATEERFDIETARLNELSSQLVAMQSISAESNSRQAAAGVSGDRMPEVLNNPVVASLKSDISRLEGRLQELTSRLGDNHPQVVETKANLTEMRSRLLEETRRVAGGVGVTGAINRQREVQVRAELEAQRAKVLRLKQIRDEASVLIRDVESAQRNYDMLLARLNQTSMESQTTQTPVNILAAASPPLQPSSPKLLLNSLVACFVGTMVGVGLALALEMSDRRVRNMDDVHAALGLPVVGVMIAPSTLRSIGGRRSTLLQQRVLGQLPAPGRGA